MGTNVMATVAATCCTCFCLFFGICGIVAISKGRPTMGGHRVSALKETTCFIEDFQTTIADDYCGKYHSSKRIGSSNSRSRKRTYQSVTTTRLAVCPHLMEVEKRYECEYSGFEFPEEEVCSHNVQETKILGVTIGGKAIPDKWDCGGDFKCFAWLDMDGEPLCHNEVGYVFEDHFNPDYCAFSPMCFKYGWWIFYIVITCLLILLMTWFVVVSCCFNNSSSDDSSADNEKAGSAGGDIESGSDSDSGESSEDQESNGGHRIKYMMGGVEVTSEKQKDAINADLYSALN